MPTRSRTAPAVGSVPQILGNRGVSAWLAEDGPGTQSPAVISPTDTWCHDQARRSEQRTGQLCEVWAGSPAPLYPNMPGP